MIDKTVEIFKIKGTKEIDDGKKDYILIYPDGGQIIIEEAVYIAMGLSYEQMKSNVAIPGAVLADIGLKIIAGAKT